MATSYTLLADLKAGCCSNTAEIHCGLVDQYGFARNKIWVIDDNIPPLYSNEFLKQSLVSLAINGDSTLISLETSKASSQIEGFRNI
ncbi:hypothetical protein YC2023_109372 [Brassica napus]